MTPIDYRCTIETGEVFAHPQTGIITGETDRTEAFIKEQRKTFKEIPICEFRPENRETLLAEYKNYLQACFSQNALSRHIKRLARYRLIHAVHPDAPPKVLALSQYQGEAGVDALVSDLHALAKETGKLALYHAAIRQSVITALAAEPYSMSAPDAEIFFREVVKEGGFALDEKAFATFAAQHLDHHVSQFATEAEKIGAKLLANKALFDQQNCFPPALGKGAAKQAFDRIVNAIPGDGLPGKMVTIALGNQKLLITLLNAPQIYIYNENTGRTGECFRDQDKINIALHGVDPEKTVLEELCHHAICLIYRNSGVPYQNNQDPRKRILEEAIEKDFYAIRSDDKRKSLGRTNLARIDLALPRSYSPETFMEEIPVKILVKMAFGTWDATMIERYPNFHKFVTEIMAADIDAYVQQNALPVIAPTQSGAVRGVTNKGFTRP